MDRRATIAWFQTANKTEATGRRERVKDHHWEDTHAKWTGCRKEKTSGLKRVGKSEGTDYNEINRFSTHKSPDYIKRVNESGCIGCCVPLKIDKRCLRSSFPKHLRF